MTTYVNPGLDASGNGNNWTTNNINWTSSGSTYDSMTDVPTLTSATTANFCTINPLIPNLQTITDGNLKVAYAAGAGSALGSIAMTTGKYYWEVTSLTASSNNQAVGIFNSLTNTTSYVGAGTNSWSYWNAGQKFTNAVGTAYGASWTAGDVIGIAVDADAGSITFYKNNVSQGVAYTGLTGPFYPAHTCYSSSDSLAVNFGQRPFAYTPPTGYVALNTYNLPTPTIGATATTQANKYFDVALWTGANTSAGNSVTGLNFSPDFVWAKVRSQGYSHLLYDRLRGTGATAELSTDSTGAEGSTSSSERGYLNSFDSAGFSSVVGSAGDNLYFNQTSQTYVAWNWKANGSGSSNTAGSITSTVSANTTAGFSIVTYTSTTGTVGHGLGVAPAMIIMKARNLSDQWTVGHKDLNGGSSPWNYGIPLNTSAATQTNSGFWNNTAPTSTVFSQGSWDSGYTKVAYCFAEIAGYSKIGSFIGNGSTDGPFVYTGFRPKYIMSKSTSTPRFWFVTDTSRDPYNVCNLPLFPNDAQGETAGTTDFDILSNGFKARTTNAAVNGNGETIIYIAFAENPFKYANAR